jgi:alkylation response protein AidB-like acyl-CoA dehydrogenase
MDFQLTEEEKVRRDEFYEVCRKLAEEKPASFIGFEDQMSKDECWEYHRYCAREFARRGWLALGWPPEYGGTGTMMDRVLLSEARGYYGIPGVDGFSVQMLAPTLLARGSEEIKHKFLPPIAKAEDFWCELWSEPNAGSDLASLTTTAIRKGNEYIINGQKTWTSCAHRADWGFGVFKTDLEKPKHHNLTFLLLDMKTPGITTKPILNIARDHVFNEVYFDDVHVPADNVVGEENEGWAVVNTLAAFERSGIDFIMRISSQLERLVAYCNEHKRNKVTLSKDPVIRNRLAQVACEVEAARALAYRIADLQNRNEMNLMDASGLKVFYSELGERFAFLAADILGSYGQVKSSQWAPLSGEFEDTYHFHFFPTMAMGTNEIQRNIIAWYGLGLPRMK